MSRVYASRRRAAVPVLGLSACLLLLLASTPAPAGEGGGIPVKTVQAIQRDTPITARGIGHAKPAVSVSVMPRVNSRLDKIHFAGGSRIKKGQVLFSLDPTTFQLALTEAQGKAKSAEASMRFAKIEAERYKKMVEKQAVAKEQADQKQAAYEEALASLESAKAAVKTAQQDLDYCTIKSPTEGVAGRYLIDVGNLVTSFQTELVVINTVDRLKVDFSLPAKDFQKVRARSQAGDLTVRVRADAADDKPLGGTLKVLSNQINPQTGMFSLEADFENEGDKFWPGQFAVVDLELEVVKGALLVPAVAILHSPKGDFVMVASDKNEAEVRGVLKVRRVGQWFMVESRDLKPGEAVITSGIIKLHKGAKVSPTPADKPAPPPAADGAKTAADETKPEEAVKKADAAKKADKAAATPSN